MTSTAKLCAVLGFLAFSACAAEPTEADLKNKLEAMHAAEKVNWTLAKEKMDAAEKVGRAWCEGNDEVTSEKLKQAFAGDDTVYNVVFEHKRKDKRPLPDIVTIVAVHDERNAGMIMSLNFSNDDTTDVHMEYAFVEGRTLAVIKATKHINPKAGDPLNTGGSITVLVRAKEDDHFKLAKKPPAPMEEKAGDKK